jgi:[protein-PII] uridylyltransferase
MNVPMALAPFMEARTEQSVRASARLGLQAAEELADHLDAAVRELAAPVASQSLAFVALGSYGRRELCRHSDIDIMLLASGEFSDGVHAVLYPLWDTGVKVGHSVRTVEDAVANAEANVETLTSLLDARLIAGDAALYERFLVARRRLVQRQRPRMVEELRHRYAELVEQEPWQLGQPDLKTSRGGLRSLQACVWVEQATAIAEDRAPASIRPELAEAYEAVLRTRAALHALTERPNDRLRLDLIDGVAEVLGVDRADCARDVLLAMRTIDDEAQRVIGGTVEVPQKRGLFSFLRRRKPASTTFGDDLDPTDDLQQLVHALQQAQPGALDPLPRAPWLERLLPEWEVLRALPHIAPFHRHPVDVHCWRAVVEARQAITEDMEQTATPTVAAELPDHAELLICALLHDIGKGHEGDHSTVGAVIAERFAARAGLDAEAAARLRAVVQHHLVLPTVATRRDIADQRVVREMAELVGDARTLRLLYLVGVADARASSPDVWSAWKAQLMRSLYLRVLAHLDAEGEPEEASERLRRDALEALDGRVPAEALERHLRVLPTSYLLSTQPEQIGAHIALIEQAAGGTAVAHDRAGDVDRLTIVTRDRPGILSLVAGTLAVHNVTVLGGTAFTRDDGVAIEVMYVADGLGHGIDERRWARVSEAVPQALAGEFPIDERLAETRRAYASATPPAPIPTTVSVDNVGSDLYSIVEVTAADRLGLLYAITSTLHALSLDIHVAKVDTIGREVVDAFYVRRENGRRIDAADEIERLRQRIEDAVRTIDADSGVAV